MFLTSDQLLPRSQHRVPVYHGASTYTNMLQYLTITASAQGGAVAVRAASFAEPLARQKYRPEGGQARGWSDQGLTHIVFFVPQREITLVIGIRRPVVFPGLNHSRLGWLGQSPATPQQPIDGVTGQVS